MQRQNKFIINFQNVDHTNAARSYITEKFSKPKFLNRNIGISEVYIKKDHKKGPDQYAVYVKAIINKVPRHFSALGSDLYAIVDKVEDKITSSVSKLKTGKKKWGRVSSYFS